VKVTIELELLPEVEALIDIEGEDRVAGDLKLLISQMGEVLQLNFSSENLSHFDKQLERVRKAFCGEVISISGGKQYNKAIGIKTIDAVKDLPLEGLNEDQVAAATSLDKWYTSGSEESIALSGPGGTGKTYMIAKWLSSRRDITASFITPTHEAKKILSKALKSSGLIFEVGTVAQFLGKQQIIDDRTGKLKFVSPVNKLANELASFVIVDESSMVSKDDYEEILLCSDKILFIGDRAQLPPVGEDSSPALDGKTCLELSEVMRSKGHLSEQVLICRSAALKKEVYVPQEGSGIKYISFNEARNIAKGLFQSKDYEDDPNLCRFLAFTNKTVDSLNLQFRELLGLSSMFEVGNRLRCYSSPTRLIRLDDELEWKFVSTRNRGDIIRVGGKPEQYPLEDYIENFKLFATRDFSELFGKLKLFEVEQDDELPPYKACTLSPSLRESKELLIAVYQKAIQEKKSSKRFFLPEKKVLQCLYSFEDVYKDLYASTVHKSQGNTIKYCFVVLNDLLLAHPRLRSALLYTACSRASEQLYIIKD